MGAYKSPIPTFRADRFELGSRRAMMETLLPMHHNRMPSEDQKDRALWAVEGLLIPGREDTRRLLAINIDDVDIPDPVDPEETITIEGEDIAGMLASARYGRITAEFPDLESLDDNVVRIVLPQEAKLPLYAAGVEKMQETFASIGGVASLGAEAVPMPAAA